MCAVYLVKCIFFRLGDAAAQNSQPKDGSTFRFHSPRSLSFGDALRDRQRSGRMLISLLSVLAPTLAFAQFSQPNPCIRSVARPRALHRC